MIGWQIRKHLPNSYPLSDLVYCPLRPLTRLCYHLASMELSGAQVKEYLDRICLPQPTRAQLRQGPDGPDALAAVATLQRHHLENVPFENLDLMYSSHHSLPQDTESVFHRVVRLKRGGVCDQIHLLFTQLLRHFGFAVYCTGSRINSAASLPVASGQASAGAGDRSKPQFGPW